MSIVVKGILTWLLLLVVMFGNGAIRVLLLEPRIGEDRARQVASLSGMCFVLIVSWLFVRSCAQARLSQLWWVGVSWLTATMAFELLFGHFASGQSWHALLADYNILRGRLWPLILVSLCLGPLVWGTVRVKR